MQLKKKIPFIIFFFFLFVEISFAEPSLSKTQKLNESQGDLLSLVIKGNESYKNGHFEEARITYEKIHERGLENGYIDYNLGNIYMRLGKIGKAIFFYKNGQKLIPRNVDLQANLQYARGQQKDKIEVAGSPFSYIENLSNSFNYSEYLLLLGVGNLLFFFAMIFLIYKKNEMFVWTARGLAGCCICLIFLMGYKYYLEKYFQEGVVLTEVVPVKSSTGVETVTLFRLHEGAEVDIVGKKKDWLKIQLRDGKKGWVKKQFISSF